MTLLFDAGKLVAVAEKTSQRGAQNFRRHGRWAPDGISAHASGHYGQAEGRP